MLAIRPSDKETPVAYSPNVMPCKIKHDGPVNSSKRLWDVQNGDGHKVAYFRGRRLVGKQVPIPEGFQGAVLQKTQEKLPAEAATNAEDDDDDDDDDDAATGDEPEAQEASTVIAQIGHFDNIVVWGHETMPNNDQDPYAKGIQEWMALANSIHRPDAPAQAE